MSRSPKPVGEAKGHRTIAEKRARQRREEDLATGSVMQEWPEVRKNAIAHKRFTKTKNLLASIKKDDALLEPIINRYAMLLAECNDLEVRRQQLDQDIDMLNERIGEMDFPDYIETKQQLTGLLLKCDQLEQTKRKMLLDIEKENGMTLLSQLRSTTRKPAEKEVDNSKEMFG